MFARKPILSINLQAKVEESNGLLEGKSKLELFLSYEV